MKKSKLKGFTLAAKILFHITLVLCGIAVIGEPIMLTYSDVINTALGVQTSVGSGDDTDAIYFNTSFNSIDDVHADRKSVV